MGADANTAKWERCGSICAAQKKTAPVGAAESRKKTTYNCDLSTMRRATVKWLYPISARLDRIAGRVDRRQSRPTNNTAWFEAALV